MKTAIEAGQVPNLSRPLVRLTLAGGATLLLNARCIEEVEGIEDRTPFHQPLPLKARSVVHMASRRTHVVQEACDEILRIVSEASIQ